jgi:hypothetical protein
MTGFEHGGLALFGLARAFGIRSLSADYVSTNRL